MSTSVIQFDSELALKQFKIRKKNNEGKQIDNASLYAGSPMYFYCKFCGVETDMLPENYIVTPKTTCTPCHLLHAHGLI